MPALKGRHNWQNACDGLCRGAGAGPQRSRRSRAGMQSFPGLAHRMQEIGRLDGVAFINDRKATNADAAAKALLVLRRRSTGSPAASPRPAASSRCSRFFPQDRAGLSDRRGGGRIRRDARRRRALSRVRHARQGGRGGGARCRAGGRHGCRRAAVAGLRLLRPISQFRSPGRCLPQGGRALAGHPDDRKGKRTMLISRSDRGLLANGGSPSTAAAERRAAADGGGRADQHGGEPAGRRAARPRLLPLLQAASSFYLVLAVVVLVAHVACSTRDRRAASALRGLRRLARADGRGAVHIGPEIKGAHRWIDIGPINLQPSEFAKPAFVVMAAWFLAEHTRTPDMPGTASLAFCLPSLRRPSGAAAGFRPDGAGRPHLRAHAAHLRHSVDHWSSGSAALGVARRLRRL